MTSNILEKENMKYLLPRQRTVFTRFYKDSRFIILYFFKYYLSFLDAVKTTDGFMSDKFS